jgi:hypothetical protein
MALIDGKKFKLIVQRYGCENKVFGDVRTRILNNYCLNDNIQSGRCLIMIWNNSGRRLFLQKKYRCFDLTFTFWGIPGDLVTRRRSLIHIAYEGAEEISFGKFKSRAITQPEDEFLRVAKEIINPIYKVKYNG